MIDEFKPVSYHHYPNRSDEKSYRYKARNKHGTQCLHAHRSEKTAQRCCDILNRNRDKIILPDNYNAGYQYAAGYHD